MADLVNSFSWSISQQQVFNECNRKYYYSRYGSWEGWPTGKGDLIAKELYILKRLKHKEAWIGELVHLTVQQVIQSLEKNPIDLETAWNHFLARMSRDLSDSKLKLYRSQPKRFTGLFADEYGEGLSEEEIQELKDHARLCLENFFFTKAYCQVKEKDYQELLSVDDELLGFMLNRTKVFVKPDLVFIDRQGKLNLIDWKTGKRESDSIELQKVCYCMLGKMRWKTIEENILFRTVNLFTGEEKEDLILPETIEPVLKGILASMDSIRALLDDPDKGVAKEDSFPKTTDEWKCRRCQFRRVCDRDKSVD